MEKEKRKKCVHGCVWMVGSSESLWNEKLGIKSASFDSFHRLQFLPFISLSLSSSLFPICFFSKRTHLLGNIYGYLPFYALPLHFCKKKSLLQDIKIRGNYLFSH